MRVFSGCDIGRVRAENQDQVCVKSFADGILALVCDGMGGMQGGKDAGIIAAAAAGSRFTADYHEGMSEVALSELMRNMTADANHAVYLAASSANLRQRMGTTLVGVFLRDNQCWIVNVGDSRAYLLGDESIRQLTVDHTVVQLLYERGDIKAEERFAHPRRNELTRAIGVMPRVLVDSFHYTLSAGESLLLCSDGLYGMLTEEEILAVIKESSPEQATERLIQRANENGGRDNISAVLLLP
ncbi:MAG: Stp1/IreP family PP2C-type Ser/Thr phosphatase [Oscillospiraceae bacterium]|nr:Stp1/IreP family PP2C-type Ser/Thr phosphatase [Oscillospiraceae bacterium]